MPNFEYKPDIGSNLESQEDPTRDNPQSFADLDSLIRDLQMLIGYLDQLEIEIEKKLVNFAIDVDRDDSRLVEAHSAEWPRTLGDPAAQISYRYYKALRLRDSTAAGYIRERFEEAARDVSGTSDLDLLKLADITRNEALLIQDFLSRYIGHIYDSSEQRLLETFQSWVQPALVYSQQLRTYFESNEGSRQVLTKEDLASITPDEAVKGQAVFKVKLNSYNDQITKNLDYLHRNFSDFAPVFYDRFLGPALNFRLKVGLQGGANPASRINEEVEDASTLLEEDLRVALADQTRRRSLYNNKMYQLQTDIKNRDRYRTMIRDLSTKGKELPTTGPRVLVEANQDAGEIDYWYKFEEEAPVIAQASGVGTLTSVHGALSGLDLNDHPQYLLRAGGHMTGDITLAPGVRIDGVDPSEHRHTGEDGSPQVHGSDIIGGTLPPDVVDPNQKPERPFNLQVESFQANIIPPGVTTIDATISWEGGTEETHEVQITRVEF